MEKLPNQSNQHSAQNSRTVFGLPKKREQVLNLLQEAFANNDLEVDDYEKRLDVAHNAKSLEELQFAVYDFPQVQTLFPQQTANTGTRPPSATPVYAEHDRFITAIGNQNIVANDINSPSIKMLSAIGDSAIDLRQIATKHSHIVIESYSGIGNLKILVPANSIIKKSILIVLGEFVQRVKGDNFWKRLFKKKEVPVFNSASNQAPVNIQITGFKLIGEVTVEFEREEKKEQGF